MLFSSMSRPPLLSFCHPVLLILSFVSGINRLLVFCFCLPILLTLRLCPRISRPSVLCSRLVIVLTLCYFSCIHRLPLLCYRLPILLILRLFATLDVVNSFQGYLNGAPGQGARLHPHDFLWPLLYCGKRGIELEGQTICVKSLGGDFLLGAKNRNVSAHSKITWKDKGFQNVPIM